MNIYEAFYNGKQETIKAETSYSAQQQAIRVFNPPKSKRHMVHVELVAIDDKQVIHSTSEV
jgi:hypothetical protein